ncbi:MAG: immune inhibitor A [Kiritimatiellae bacterium]|nr:immune inhibitor A [Kiritimatiellia bacterium]
MKGSRWFVAGVVSVCVSVFLANTPVTAQELLYDDFESGLAAWETNGTWNVTTAFAVSPTRSVTDSPGSYYTNGTDSAIALAAGLNLTGLTRPCLVFWHRYALEAGYDFGQVGLSTNGAVSWETLEAFTGTRSAWAREQLDLADYAGEPDVRVRFRLMTDGSVVMDGWYIDDVRMAEGPEPAVLDTPPAVTANSVALTWTASSSTNLAGYRLYRAASPGVDWRMAHVVADLLDSAATNYTDVTPVPKTTYYYALMVLASNDVHSMSGEISATTAAGMDYPFLDNGEGGGGVWVADAPWALSDEDAVSATHAWSDSPGTNYGNSVNAAIRLAAPLDLTGGQAPVLCFNHKYDFLGGDSGNVEISTDGGQSWGSPLAQYSGVASAGWERKRIDLSAYTNSADVLLRFRVTTDTANGADGWHVDDISVGEAPETVNAPVLSDVESHAMRLTWLANTNVLFSHYAVFRSTAAGVGINSTLVTNISEQSTTTCVDSGLALNTVYYYRVYAVSPYGTYSADGTESNARTLNNPSPFADGFEAGLDAWNITGGWTVITDSVHQGTFAMTDSPGTTYSNSMSMYFETAVDLTGTTWPVLAFWDRYELAAGDWARVQISTDGVGYWGYYGVSGTQTDWQRKQIDLSAWRSQSNLRIRFLFTSDGGTTADGWSVDDVSVAEHAPVALEYPFAEPFDTELTNWMASAWLTATNMVKDGAAAGVDTRDHALAPDTSQELSLAGRLNLTNAADPQLTFWVAGALWYKARFRVRASVDDGQTWPDLYALNNDWTSDWARVQLSLNSYKAENLRLRIITWAESGTAPGQDFYIDKLSIAEMPAPVAIEQTTSWSKAIDVFWTVSAAEHFASNLVYRATHASVGLGDTLVGAFADPGVTNLTDSGLSIGATYYYKVYTVNSNDTFVASNERSSTTVPFAFPLADGMEDLTQWDAAGGWAVNTNDVHGGSGCLSDSPDGDYANGASATLLTAVDLTGTTWPVLTFWDRYQIAPGDWARVQVSTDGSGYGGLYGVSGTQTDWRRKQIDLSAYRGQPNLRIRFLFTSDGSTTMDGWNIDDIRVEEHVPAGLAFPFAETFEGELTNWLASAWLTGTNGVQEGESAAVDTRDHSLAPDTSQELSLAGELNLTNAVDPQLTFWFRGALWYKSRFRVRASVDDGATWPDLYALNSDWSGDWSRVQLSLGGYKVEGLRLRVMTWTESGTSPGQDIWIDKLSVAEMPAAVAIEQTAAASKSIDLFWTASTADHFASNLVFRATHASVGLGDTLIAAFSDPAVTNLTDSALSIGATYYYKIYTVNSNDTFMASNERSDTTVPFSFPFTDGMEDLTQWDAAGGWAVNTNNAHGGSACLSDSPEGDYNNSASMTLLTAVDLRGSTWPVLTFWDRHQIAAGDWARVQVSTDGSGYWGLYGVSGTQTDWQRKRIDLSAYRDQANLRIRFLFTSDGSTTMDGWDIDDVAVEEHVPAPLSLPFQDTFEGELTNWLSSAWLTTTSVVHEGSAAAIDTRDHALAPDTAQELTLAGELNLSNAVNPQLIFWLRGALWYKSRFRVRVSADDGLTWPDLYWINSDWSADWARVQLSLSGYKVEGLRLRLSTWAEAGTSPGQDVLIDKLSIEELPDPVVLSPLDDITVSSLRLTWTPYAGGDFAEYRIYRHTATGVSEGSELVAIITNPATTTFTDTGLQGRRVYYYRVYVADTSDLTVGSNEAYARTLGVVFPWSDGFETNSAGWTRTGTWTNLPGVGRAGGTALVDSPADYVNSSDSYALFAVNLAGSEWPVLRFWERCSIAENDWGRFEVSVNDGASWWGYHGLYGARTNWTERRVDLSPWRSQENVWLRFRLFSDGGTTADGWYVDDLTVEEQQAAAGVAFPFYEDFENGLDRWLPSSWATTTNTPYAGVTAVCDTPDGRIPPDTTLILALGAPLDLSLSTDPLLTYWLRGSLWYKTRYRTQVSTNATDWIDLHVLNSDWNQPDWTKVQVSLNAYRETNVWLRFLSWSEAWSTPDENICLDNIGIGDPAPGTPSLSSPLNYQALQILRPTLTVTNAIDYQGDALSYRFEVYSDEDLSNLVAQVPVIASGAERTSWEVDTDLANNAQYWWRCQASDLSNAGPWMATATFYVNQTNAAPLAPVIAGPPAGAILPDTTALLYWYASTDPDVGDSVIAYHIQVDSNSVFASPTVDDDTVVIEGAPPGTNWVAGRELGSLEGASNLLGGITYFWRMRAEDSWHDYSDWSAGTNWFVIHVPPPDILGGDLSVGSGQVLFQWERTTRPVYVYWTDSLTNDNWQPVLGPLYGTNAPVDFPPGFDHGFFRVQTE